MNDQFKKVGVIGAGVMGARIAAMFAGAEVRVELLDLAPHPSSGDRRQAADPKFRSRLASQAIDRLKVASPPAFYKSADAHRIRPGNLEDHLERLSECGWVIECVVERLETKQNLYARLREVLSPDAIISSNTSGLSWQALTDGMSDDLKRRFLITHFFNPPRYMKLVEMVCGPETGEAEAQAVSSFVIHRLGKGVVRAKDTPAFIANRIGVFHALDVMNLTMENGWPIEAVDAVLGRATGRPKRGLFGTADLVGLDTLAYVAEHIVKGCPHDAWIGRVRIPQFLQRMVVKGWTGDKVGRGFYFKPGDGGTVHALDLPSFDYRPRVSFHTASLQEASRLGDAAASLRCMVWAKDQASEIAWPAISRMMVYAAERIPEISDDILSVDQAMRWGYRWELGPFETWDALGVDQVASRLEQEGQAVPKLVERLLASDHNRFYEWRAQRRHFFDFGAGRYGPMDGSGGGPTIARLKESGGLVDENSAASIVDVGDGIFVCEFHTKMNSIDQEIVAMLHSALDRVEGEGRGLLIYNDGENFSVGANLHLVLALAKEARFAHLDQLVRGFQDLTQRIRFFPKLVIAAPAGRALGGGCEICLAAACRVAAIESYMGLVEVGVGLIPAGGGCKNLLLAMEERERFGRRHEAHLWNSPDDGGPGPKVGAAFKLIARASVSRSAREATGLGFLTPKDHIVLDRDSLLDDARNALITRSGDYEPPAPRENIVLPGRGGEMALVGAARDAVNRGQATEYDAFVASQLARVLAGGDVPTIHTTTEKHILDLEREAFLSLAGEEKTQQRMEHMLKTGKPLRN